MIILDDISTKTPREPQLAIQEQEVTAPEPPADLPASSCQHATAVIETAGRDGTYLESRPVDVKGRQRTAQRFLEALGAAVLIWVFLAVSARGTIGIARWRSKSQAGLSENELGWPTERDGKIVRCVSGSKSWPQHDSGARASFELPLSADVLYMFSRGTLSKGDVVFIQSQEWTERQQTVHVDVDIQYNTMSQLDATSVCLFERTQGQFGIGFLFPASVDWEPLRVKSFETVLPRFTQRVGDSRGGVIFNSLSLRSAFSPIMAKSLFAHHADVRTTDSAIEGDFYTSGDLRLVTTNGPIKANASLFYNHADKISANKTYVSLSMQSSNGPILSKINLFSEPAVGGDFTVSVQTANDDLNLDFATSPLDARLGLRAKTTNAPAVVSMNSVLEGRYKLITNGKIDTPFYPFAEDPAGQGRVRSLFRAGQKGYVEGVYTRQEPPYRGGQGMAEVETTNAPITFDLL
ncbi:hypothetical protein WOLCODRAFT_20113 [Wolfiporia cocos MD-104 SS10]|uniref:Uncharacterized protein n=1 Tax=Wolfiporia cocos (strain MD-104) TaxID=742152 RepID=A0A2H3J0I7_WOLCO|nr:hypothetical protein WOLCODRAFT_20113 [Wolfiporia cocos MD-104 SS10]